MDKLERIITESFKQLVGKGSTTHTHVHAYMYGDILHVYTYIHIIYNVAVSNNYDSNREQTYVYISAYHSLITDAVTERRHDVHCLRMYQAPSIPDTATSDVCSNPKPQTSSQQ